MMIKCKECDGCQFQLWDDGHVQCVGCCWSFNVDIEWEDEE